ncbi:MAG: prolyl aminopeptidase [Oligoflexales bacterium]|nr:prolyl aminopeptidase [Oligoflexales bacterium]
MTISYPPIDPFHTFSIKVSKLHTLSVEQVGNPKGTPIIYLHGGPGGCIDPENRQFFDPEKWNVILFDQRGCGKSTPHACVEENTTWDLVADIEKIREHLGIKKWHVFGGSWGSTLSLTYAISHPERVESLILRGIFLLRKREIDWFYQWGASEIFPEQWEKFASFIPAAERSDLVKAYAKRLLGSDPELAQAAAKVWSSYEGALSRLRLKPELLERFSDDHFSRAFAFTECHYFVNGGFFKEDNWILNNISRIKDIPGVIIHGRYDVICPARNAWELHRSWPKSELIIVPDAGHSAGEAGITKALLEATDRA